MIRIKCGWKFLNTIKYKIYNLSCAEQIEMYHVLPIVGKHNNQREDVKYIVCLEPQRFSGC